MANGDEDILQTVPRAAVVVDIACGDRREANTRRQTREGSDTARVAEDKVLLELDGDIARTKPLDVTIEQMAGIDPPLLVDQA
jgi:hypothetical protein